LKVLKEFTEPAKEFNEPEESPLEPDEESHGVRVVVGVSVGTAGGTVDATSSFFMEAAAAIFM